MTEIFRLSRRVLLAGAAALCLYAPSTIRALAEAPAKIDNADMFADQALPDMFVGKADAPVTIVEYASLTCSHCAAFHQETFPALVSKYIDTGKARFVLREFPLDPLATAGFMLARCSGDKRNAIVDLLFTQQRSWAFIDKPLEALQNTVKQAGIGEEAFKKCLDDKGLYQNVMKVRQRASEKFGVDATPTFFINGVRKNGEITPNELDSLLAPYLDKK